MGIHNRGARASRVLALLTSAAITSSLFGADLPCALAEALDAPRSSADATEHVATTPRDGEGSVAPEATTNVFDATGGSSVAGTGDADFAGFEGDEGSVGPEGSVSSEGSVGPEGAESSDGSVSLVGRDGSDSRDGSVSPDGREGSDGGVAAEAAEAAEASAKPFSAPQLSHDEDSLRGAHAACKDSAGNGVREQASRAAARQGTPAKPQESVVYVNEAGESVGCDAYTVVTSDFSGKAVGDGTEYGAWYVVRDDVELDERLAINGTVHLILCDGAKLTARDGIDLLEGNTLKVYAQSNGDKEGVLETASFGDKANSDDADATPAAGELVVTGGLVAESKSDATEAAGSNGSCAGTATVVSESKAFVGNASNGQTTDSRENDNGTWTQSVALASAGDVRGMAGMGRQAIAAQRSTYASAKAKDHSEKPIFTLTLNANDGDDDPETFDVVSAEAGYSRKAPNCPFACVGRTFVQWNTEPDGSGNTYAVGDWIKLSDDLVLYAQWETNTYVVTFESNGGSRVDRQRVMHGDMVVRPDDPTRDGYKFAGWFVDGSLKFAFDFTIPVAGPLTLHAKWKKLSIEDATVSLGVQTYTYDGSAKRPIPEVRLGGKTLRPRVDYLVTYKNNVEAGTGVCTVTGRGLYVGKSIAEFVIEPASFSVLAPKAQTYTGKAILAMPTVRSGDKTLGLGSDCAVRWENNVDVGTATITVTGKRNYAGTRRVTFEIVEEQ